MADEPRASLREIAALFLRLGATAFGGPAAHIAMMEEQVVRRRRWLSRERFLDLLAISNLIPGPSSTELAIHIGHAQRGAAGLVVAGLCFIVPAMLIVLALAWAYVEYGRLPEVRGLLYGVMPVVVAIVANALWLLGRTAVKSWQLGVIAAAALAAVIAGAHELAVLLVAGVAAAAFAAARRGQALALLPFVPIASAAIAVPYSLAALFGFFVKVGAVLFGSGYVLIAFLRVDLVERWQWLTETQLVDAIAIGQVTPGPLFTTATFIGYLLDGVPGALVATAGIFLPAFIFVALSGPFVSRLRASPVASAALDGVTAASLALMAYATYAIGRTAFVDVASIAIAVIAFALLVWKRVGATWLIAAGGAIGLARVLAQ